MLKNQVIFHILYNGKVLLKWSALFPDSLGLIFQKVPVCWHKVTFYIVSNAHVVDTPGSNSLAEEVGSVEDRLGENRLGRHTYRQQPL